MNRAKAREINRAVWHHLFTLQLLVMVVAGTGTMTLVKDPGWLDLAYGVLAPALGLWWAIARIAADVIEIQHKEALARLRKTMRPIPEGTSPLTQYIREQREDGNTG